MNTTINKQVYELRELKHMRDELDAEITKLENAIKAVMTDMGVAELSGTDWTATYKTVSSTRLDSKKLKAEMLDVYQAYSYQSVCKRFVLK